MPLTREIGFSLLVWGHLALIGVADAIALQVMGIDFLMGEMRAPTTILIAVAFAAMALRCYLAHKAQFRPLTEFVGALVVVARFVDAFAQYIAFIWVAAIVQYIGAASPLPFYDGAFLAMDEAMGFFRLEWLEWINNNPDINQLLYIIYNSFAAQMAVLLFLLAALGRTVAMHRLMLATIYCLIACVAIAALLPATSAYAYLHIQEADYPNVFQKGGSMHLADLYLMREGMVKTLELTKLNGMLTFPSFHAAFGVLLMWGFWGIKWLRLPFLLLNIVMLISTPITGGHYLVDVIGGIAIALGMIVLVKAMTRSFDSSSINQLT